MRKMLLIVGIAALAVTLVGLFADRTVSAHGLNPDQVERAGGFCFVPGPPGTDIHCTPKGQDATDAQLQVLIFEYDAPHHFLGTETLIRADLYAGQPCPTDEVLFLPASETGLPADYYACHHFDFGG